MVKGAGAAKEAPRRYRILVVDDDEAIRTLLEHTLTRAKEFDCDVTLAMDARQGLAELAQKPYDLVLSDQIMPEANGIAFLMEVKDRYPDTIRMLITAHTNLSSVLRAVNLAQVHGYIEKPFDPLEVNHTINEALSRHEERLSGQVINVQSVQDATKMVREFEERLAGAPSEMIKAGLTFVFDSPTDFNRFTFEMVQSKASTISDVHVFEGRFHVTVTVHSSGGRRRASS